MQTFITDLDISTSMKNLDNKRLGKQRVEALQIADCLLVRESRWKNHPAVKMWRGYEDFLILIYIKSAMDEWTRKGFKNEKCLEWWKSLLPRVRESEIGKPFWINENFVKAHRSNLIRKNANFYKNKWPDIPDNLPYIWPV